MEEGKEMNQGDTEDAPTPYDVAIVGMACRFPGAGSVDRFWRNLRDGVESITFFTKEEARAAGDDPAALDHPDYVRARGAVEGVDLFDAPFFGCAAREAEIMDPQHRIFLRLSWEALEDAGCDPDRFDGRIGVYSGTGVNTYLLHHLLPNREVMEGVDPFRVLLANTGQFAPARVSYRFDLTGPSINVGSSCSTSLAAAELACQGLMNFQCDMALAGGARIDLPQERGHLYREGGILSPDGHCRAFDARAGGTVSGNGAGVVALKRLADALEDGDHIYAVVKGGAVNNGGAAKVGCSAPGVEGQAEAIAEAQAVAGVEAGTVSYVEAHGTATPMGDPVEMRALTRAFRLTTRKKGFCAVGSVKTNIGPLDAASGAAALIKTALSLSRGTIPPSLHFTEPNPEIDFENSPFFVNTVPREWKRGRTPRRAGVSAFGVGGTNVHLVLEEAPETRPPDSPSPRPAHQLLILSARSAAALDRAAANLAKRLEETPRLPLPDAACTLAMGRKAFDHRRYCVCGDAREAVEALTARDPGGTASAPPPGAGAGDGETGAELIDALADPGIGEAERARLLDRLGALWLRGASISWGPLYASRRHVRLSLPTYPFEERSYWIEARSPRGRTPSPASAGKRSDVDRWFYLPSWRRTPPVIGADGENRGASWLIFLDEHGLGRRLAAGLRGPGDRVVTAGRGEGFSEIGADRYEMDMENEADYRALLRELARSGGIPGRIVHTESLTAEGDPGERRERPRTPDFYSLLHLARALEREAPNHPVALSVISDRVLEVSGEEPLIPEKAAMLGPVKVIPQERPHVGARFIDIAWPESETARERLAERLMGELRAGIVDAEIAYRGEHRWTPRPEAVPLAADRERGLLKKGGAYLITGGLGAIGLTLARRLAEKYGAGLVLVGRSAPDADGRERVEALRALGVEVLALEADAAREEEMAEAIRAGEAHFGKIDGVFHAAGVTGGRAFRSLTEAGREACEAQFRPKIRGLAVLGDLLEGKDLDFCLLFSSLSAVLGGVGFAAYAAANLYMDAFARMRRRTDAFPWICVDWDGWRFDDGAGEVDAPGGELLEFAIRPEEGMDALERILSGGLPHLIVSTGDLSERIRRWTGGKSPGAPGPAGGGGAAAAHPRPDLPVPWAAPTNEIEEKLAEIWRELFALERVGIHDDFFDLNGDSVLAVQAVSRIREVFDMETPLPAILENPTISLLGQYILAGQLERLGEDELEEILGTPK